MRFLFAAVALAALAACGQNTPPAAPPAAQAAAPAPTVPEEWRAQLTDNPNVARQYGPGEFAVAVGTAKIGVTPDYLDVTTSPGLGAFSAYVNLGSDAEVHRARALRLTVTVETGSLQFVSTYNGFPAGYQAATRDVAAGPQTTIYLSVDDHAAPMLVIANASRDGASKGRISNIELVTAP